MQHQEPTRLCWTAETSMPDWEIDIMVLRSSDICDPHPSWSFTSTSWCIRTSLLRLQEILLSKFAMTGLVLPGISSVVLPLPPIVSKFLGFLSRAHVHHHFQLRTSSPHPPQNLSELCFSQRFRKGVGGRGWRPTAPKTQQKLPPCKVRWHIACNSLYS